MESRQPNGPLNRLRQGNNYSSVAFWQHEKLPSVERRFLDHLAEHGLAGRSKSGPSKASQP